MNKQLFLLLMLVSTGSKLFCPAPGRPSSPRSGSRLGSESQGTFRLDSGSAIRPVADSTSTRSQFQGRGYQRAAESDSWQQRSSRGDLNEVPGLLDAFPRNYGGY